ncbi:SpoIVB peptidase|uniref:Stage IV sporulation protein B n=1 Tax=Dendrosporobacter quercicolus TaxID=146817 RepID=A0A1G9KZX4_9FIRM|nr:SpoIVB peptidase [Dendrosporobacter quercicolus]NSL46542.1 SpoIVB peptidase [Dendrosporobacter quercicolus DSM 1736]SDL55063.1 stage IV sporulation protein B [Dendrosporobacter quercicolus]
MLGTKWRSVVGMCIAVLIIAFSSSPQFRNIYGLPLQMRIIQGETAFFNVNYPLTVTVSQDLDDSLRIKTQPSGYAISRPVFLEPVKLGRATVEFKLLGLIPIRTVQVDVLPQLKLVPGGHSIGVVMQSHGVIVVGNSPVQVNEGQYVTPAKDSGIQVGDVILGINDTPVHSDSQVAEMIDGSGREQVLQFLIKRGDEQLTISVKTVLCNDTKRYRIGLFVRDSAAGVGTLTFYEPGSQAYGALGHVITDNDTNQPIDCEQGKIVPASVSGIQQGKRGQPGEKIGVFIEEDQLLGNIQKNTKFGIYGKLNQAMDNAVYSEALPVASMNQVQTGAAEMLTVVEGQTIERFAIEIQRINLQNFPESKGLVIKVVDSRLLERTGGIVQGMSGSPIIQNGKIVGAVTHVFVHDPTKGYGCFIDWMLMESGIIPPKEQQTSKRLFTYGSRLNKSA